ncbi:MAG: hypothetical protein ABI461_22850, partial [Polyangiaceae bacterium]
MKLSRTLGFSAALIFCGLSAQADTSVPPWTDPGDIPLPTWAKSVVPHAAETPVFTGPGKVDEKRGVLAAGARLPLYGAKRGAMCVGRWLEIGPLAWVCSDAADLSA